MKSDGREEQKSEEKKGKTKKVPLYSRVRSFSGQICSLPAVRCLPGRLQIPADACLLSCGDEQAFQSLAGHCSQALLLVGLLLLANRFLRRLHLLPLLILPSASLQTFFHCCTHNFLECSSIFLLISVNLDLSLLFTFCYFHRSRSAFLASRRCGSLESIAGTSRSVLISFVALAIVVFRFSRSSSKVSCWLSSLPLILQKRSQST